MAISDIGLARRQRVFVASEGTVGTLKFPVSTDFIRPAGNAVMNQKPEFKDSEELQDSLDVLDRFQNAMPAGEWSIPMYVRPVGSLSTSSLPQGSALWLSLQGTLVTGTTAALTTNISAGATSLTYTGLSGTLPEKGVVKIGSENIRYETVTATTATTGSLTSLSRGYSGSAATHATAAPITLSSIAYVQAATSPSVSIWIETDHFVQGMSGATAKSVKLSLSNEGAVKADFSGQGMQMVWAGSSTLSTTVSTNATHIHVANAKLFSAGAYIYNSTDSDDNSDSGFLISSVNATTNVMVITPGVTVATWATDAVIRGFLPTASVIGDPIESRNTTVELNNAAGYFKSGDLTIECSKKYITDEIGTTYPQGYLEEQRNITSTLGMYFRKAYAQYFTDGYAAGNEVPVLLTFGNAAGKYFEVYMKRCKLEVPTVSISAPAVELSIPLKALGTDGEDSCELYFR